MTPNEFWAIIDRARQRAAPNSEPAIQDALYAELVQLPALKLSAWQDLQYAYMDLMHISDTQLGYITDVPAGCGLIRCGGQLVPFTNAFPTGTDLYKLMTTKPDEMMRCPTVARYKNKGPPRRSPIPEKSRAYNRFVHPECG